MSNRILPPPFIAEPPIYNDLLDENSKIKGEWVNWLNSITRVMGYVIVHDYIVNPADNVKEQETPLLQAVALTTTQRDRLENARDGTILYNLTTNRFNFRENGTWVTFTAIPA